MWGEGASKGQGECNCIPNMGYMKQQSRIEAVPARSCPLLVQPFRLNISSNEFISLPGSASCLCLAAAMGLKPLQDTQSAYPAASSSYQQQVNPYHTIHYTIAVHVCNITVPLFQVKQNEILVLPQHKMYFRFYLA